MNSHISRLLRRRPSESARTARRSAKSRRPTLRPEPLESRAMLAAGGLDTTFDADGIAIYDLSAGQYDEPRSVAIQSDNKLVIAGLAGGSFIVTRFNADGTLDASFDGDGKAIIPFPEISRREAATGTARSVAIDSLGRIVVAGDVVQKHVVDKKTNRIDADFALARLNANGTLDSSFGVGGKVLTDFSGNESVWKVALQADGKILVTGQTANGPKRIVRYVSSGGLDSSFDGDGVANLPSQVGNQYGLTLQPDGKIVTAGFGSAEGVAAMSAVRLASNGTLDTSFGIGGVVTVEASSPGHTEPGSRAWDAVTDAAGNIIMVGNSSQGYDAGGTTVSGGVVVRLQAANGALDPSFDADGIAFVPPSPGTAAYTRGLRTVVVEASGKIVVAGSGGSLSEIWRLEANGSIDVGFGASGVATGVDGVLLNDIALHADQRIVAVGKIGPPPGGTVNLVDWFVTRLLNDSPLLATATGPGAPASAPLTDALLAPIVAEARARWATLGVDPARLTGLRITTADLNGPYLGLASGNSITLDRDAARWGWFIDSTPADDAEFLLAGNQGEQNRVDLLTAVMHEMGHVLGLGHDNDSGDLMYESLAAGTRHTPDAGDALAAALAYSFDQFATKERKSR